MNELVLPEPGLPNLLGAIALPEAVELAGNRAMQRYIDFFTVTIRNDGTREAYARATADFFDWCHSNKLAFEKIAPHHVAMYIQLLTKTRSAPTVKLRLAAIRMLYDWLVVGQIVEFNPAAAVRGPKHVVKEGKTSVLTPEEAAAIIKKIDVSTPKGLRDRAVIGVMVFSFARVSATLSMDVEDYFSQSGAKWLRLHEKGSKHHVVPAHHRVIEYLHDYLEAGMLKDRFGTPLFRTIGPNGELTANRMHRSDALRMIKLRAKEAQIESSVSCHSWRATGITTYLKNGGTLEKAAQIAAHESPRTTKLYDRTSNAISLDEIERVRI